MQVTEGADAGSISEAQSTTSATGQGGTDDRVNGASVARSSGARAGGADGGPAKPIMLRFMLFTHIEGE